MGEIANRLNERPPDTLPSNTEQNPKAFAKAVTTRSGVGARSEPMNQEPAIDGKEQVDEEIQMESPPVQVHQRRSPGSTTQADD